MNKIKVSVIIPIYNVEQYIERCARSLMEQTMKDGIEFIFVNDCTPDKSVQILERVVSDYPERVNQVFVVNNSNNIGVTETRKKGIKVAKGEYIGWCDGDDWCDNEMFQEMYNVAVHSSSDIVVCDYWNVEGETMIRSQMIPSNSPQEAVKKRYLNSKSFSFSLWNQIIRKCYFEKCWDNVTPVNFSEDTFVLSYIYYYAKSIRFVKKPLYFYRSDNENSLVNLHEITRKTWLIHKKNMEDIEKLYYENNGWKQYHITINAWLFGSKIFYKKAFLSDREFFYTFKRASKDILRFYDWRKLSSWKMYLVHNFYFFYRLANNSFV